MAKLTREEKIEIYQRRLKGESTKSLAFQFHINFHRIEYLIRLLNKHGYDILRNGKNKSYSKEVKESAINRVLQEFEPKTSVAIDIGLTSPTILGNWIQKYKENCYNVIEKRKGRKPTMIKIKKIKKQNLTLEEKMKELEQTNLYLEAENEYLKKLNALVLEEELQNSKESEL